MPLTRAMLKDMGLTEEQVGRIIDAHVEVKRAVEEQRDALQMKLDGLTGERDALQSKLDGLAGERDALQAKLEAIAEAGDAPREADDRDWRGEYAALEKRFDEYRAGIERQAAQSARQAAYRGLLAEARIPERFHERILRLTDLDALELDGDGLDAAREAVRRDWGDYIAVERVRGVPVDTPPDVRGPAQLTARQIMSIPDDDRREREIARNHELFGF